MLDNLESVSTLALFILGIALGLKHATEVDHVVAVSTIVSQHKSILRSSLVGLMWGAGHTAALLVVGVVVLSLRVAVPVQVSTGLEFAVALMIIAIGISALWRALRSSSHVHLHEHTHDGLSHIHIHFHENETKHEPTAPSRHSHSVSRIGWKPALIGTVHGLAGSGALTLLVLTHIDSVWLGFSYLAVFGFGSMAGMVLMSGLVGLPFALTSRRLTYAHHRLQTVAAVLSICFGLWYAYDIAAASSLF